MGKPASSRPGTAHAHVDLCGSLWRSTSTRMYDGESRNSANEMRPFAPEVRWVGPETFHITLQFLGETKKLEEIQRSLREVRGTPIELNFRNAGFFPSSKSPRVFWVGIEADQNLQALVNLIGEALQPLGFERDAGSFKPHLTLARVGSGRPRSSCRGALCACFAAGAGQVGNPWAAGVRYNGRARVLSLREQAVPGGRAVFQAVALCAEVASLASGSL